MKKKILLILLLFFAYSVQAQELLEDRNQDGQIKVLGFGNSIAYGMGDLHEPGEFIEDPLVTSGNHGFLKRLRELGGLATTNRADPGEFFTTDGILRFPGVVANSNADLVAFLEGANDSGIGVTSEEYSRTLQKAINIARASGKEIVVFTLSPPCCNRASRAPITRSYSRAIRNLAAVNEVSVADIERAWETTCDNINSCNLYNRPDGLHPNRLGYDVIGQVLLATLFDIDIFALDGPAKLESALGLEEGTVVVVPAEQPPEENAEGES